MENKVIIFGLPSAGKTTLSRQIKEKGNSIREEENNVFNINQMILHSAKFLIQDVPGEISIDDSWRMGVPENIILLFVLDTADGARFDQAKNELDKVMNNLNLRSFPLIVCFHKMDLQAAQNNYAKARGTLKLPLIQQREVFFFKTSAITREGIVDLKAKLVELIEQARW